MDAPPTAKLTPEHEKLFREKLDRAEPRNRVRPVEQLRSGRHAALVVGAVPERVRRHAAADVAHQRDAERDSANLHGRPRSHRAEDAYPLWEGDSIGFWDGDKLVIHTNSMRAGQYQRPQPFYTEQVEVVEVWQKTADDTMTVDIWSYDPPALVEPWYARVYLQEAVERRQESTDPLLGLRRESEQHRDKTETGSSDFSRLHVYRTRRPVRRVGNEKRILGRLRRRRARAGRCPSFAHHSA